MSFGMVERVARALAEDNGGMEWQLYMPDAEIAIKAMREPTEGMIAAGNEVGVQPFIPAGGFERMTWQAMIDAALNPASNDSPDPS